MKLTRSIYLCIGWVVLLFAGVGALSVMTSSTSEGSGEGIGYFRYWFRYTLMPHADRNSTGLLSGIVDIEGEAPERFMMDGSKSPEYREVKITWDFYHNREEGSCTVDLAGQQILSGPDRLPLDRSGLRSLFGLDASMKDDDPFLDDLLSKLEAAARGTMPRPRHHTYRYEKTPAVGDLQHWAFGQRLDTPVAIWVAVWLGLPLIVVLIKRALKRKKRRLNPA